MGTKDILIKVTGIAEKVNSNEIAHWFIRILKLGKLYSFFLSFFILPFLSGHIENPYCVEVGDEKICLDTTNYVPFWVYVHSLSRDPIEPATFDLLNALVKEGSVVYDIGAEIGIMSLYCDLKGAKTYAFETSVKCVSTLQKK